MEEATTQEMLKGRKVYWAIFRLYPDCTREQVQEVTGLEVGEQQYEKIFRKVAEVKARGPRKKERSAPPVVVPEALQPPEQRERDELLGEIEQITVNDGEVIILDDPELSFQSMEAFIRFTGAVQAAGGIRKAIGYLKLMVDLQRNLVR